MTWMRMWDETVVGFYSEECIVPVLELADSMLIDSGE